ncbi:Histone H4 [Seminavis robusta]|uniref:Histone H4 n=1 Tax=Seminavis robusta TaxID=568900 RepID=A0A9N8EST4_9STRA|nr:Histone H4 [Seminavis robusta]|eukprot:Sro1582_g283880.1 Histone H4 (120) ;mRNA; r:21812-22440
MAKGKKLAARKSVGSKTVAQKNAIGFGGKGMPKRARIHYKSGAIHGISKPAIRRLARRAGCKRVSGLIYEETRGVLKYFLERVIRDSIVYMEHAQRRTLAAKDVLYALKHQGKTLYGFG